MKTYFKQKRFRSQRYTRWVKSRPSCISGKPADDPHHLIGNKDGGVKADDRLTMPLTREEHTELHRDPKAWEARFGPQKQHIRRTLEQARYFEQLRPDMIDEALEMISD